MKRVFVLLGVVVALISCGKKEDQSQGLVENQYAQILEGVEELNFQFGCLEPSTRGNAGRDGVKAAADIAGGIIGTQFGAEIGAAIGSAVGNVPGAFVGYLGGRKYGGMVGVAVGSYIAGVVFDWIHGGSATTGTGTGVGYADPIEWTDGVIHNEILARLLLANPLSPVTRSSEGGINISQLFDNAISIAQELVDDPIEIDPNLRSVMEEYCKSVESVMLEVDSADADFDTTLNRILEKQGVSVNETLLSVYNNLFSSRVLGDASLNDYEASFLKMIEDSNLPEKDKTVLSSTGSITIRSGNFWYKSQE